MPLDHWYVTVFICTEHRNATYVPAMVLLLIVPFWTAVTLKLLDLEVLLLTLSDKVRLSRKMTKPRSIVELSREWANMASYDLFCCHHWPIDSQDGYWSEPLKPDWHSKFNVEESSL